MLKACFSTKKHTAQRYLIFSKQPVPSLESKKYPFVFYTQKNLATLGI